MCATHAHGTAIRCAPRVTRLTTYTPPSTRILVSAVAQKEPGDGGSRHGAPPVGEASALGIEGDVTTLIVDDEASKGHGDAEERGAGCGADDENDGILAALRTALGSAESTTFFAAVAISGIGMGVIDTFLFIW